MLVLARRIDQEVLIRVPGRDEPIVIKILEVGQRAVKLGFAAEDDIKIFRGELVDEG